jgi:hypothetical protein
MTTSFQPLQPWTPAPGVVQVENYSAITGPVQNIMVSPTNDISFQDRQIPQGFFSAPDNTNVFGEYRGSTMNGFGLTWDHETDQTWFTLVFNQTITTNFTLPRVAGASATSYNSTSRLVVASWATDNGDAVHAFTIDTNSGNILYTSSSNTGTKADKIRTGNFQNSYIAFGLD